jgi:hypothetical protein
VPMRGADSSSCKAPASSSLVDAVLLFTSTT